MKSLGCIIASLALTGCFNHWSEEDRIAFENECARTKTFSGEVFIFRGFEDKAFDSVTVVEYKGNLPIDTFKMYVWPANRDYRGNDKVRSGTADRQMNVDYAYHFLVPGQAPYVLSDMKMVMWSQYTMFSEGYGCVMGDYTIDGMRFEHNGNPEFVKRQ